jgi:chromosome segregation ATPase
MAEAPDDRIRATATKREELLSVIASTEHAKAALGRIKLDIAALKGPWYDADALYSDLIARSTDEKKEYKELSESHMKKLFGGSKHQEKLKIKENELDELQEWMVKADKARKELTSQLDGLKKSRDSLEKMVVQRTQAQIDLEALYALVFNGPSPTNPEEDMLEQELQKAQDVSDCWIAETASLSFLEIRFGSPTNYMFLLDI